MTKTTWTGKKAVVLGAARQGLALARYLATHGADVTLNDSRTAEELNLNMADLENRRIRLVAGGHPLELLNDCETLFLSGGVSPELPLPQEALQRGIPLSNDSQVLLEEISCKVIGITGSAGKTTTTTLVGRMAEAGWAGKVWVGGNIGLPLITFAQEIKPADMVILELSSFQLELMSCSPQIVALLNITPNHLDRHKTMEAYASAKSNILRFQNNTDTAILNREDHGSISLKSNVNGDLFTFGFHQPGYSFKGSFIRDNWIYFSDGEHQEKLFPLDMILLRGKHNQMNILAAGTIAAAAGIGYEAIRKGITGFKGVEHRLEFVRTLNGAAWYNDSIATAPERTEAAILSFDQPIVLLLGGRDKNLPWQHLKNLVQERVRTVILFGEAASLIEEEFTKDSDSHKMTIIKTESLKDAVQTAAKVAIAGDAVLLSPGGTSFDEFKDFAERGVRFREWVNNL